MTSHLSIEPLTTARIPATAAFLLQQDLRLQLGDGRLRGIRMQTMIEDLLTQQVSALNASPVLLAVNERGDIRGVGQPAIWTLPPHSLCHAFLPARNGIVRALTLPSPTEGDALEVLDLLLQQCTRIWQDADTTGDLLRWPSIERWMEPVLLGHGFILDRFCALATLPPIAPRRTQAATQRIRPARPEETDALMALFQEGLQVQEDSLPFACGHPEALAGFRDTFTRLWSAYPLEKGVPLVLVVEEKGEVIAMAENTVVSVTLQDEPGFTPPGRYGCINILCVRQDKRGQGIGQLLVQAIFTAFRAMSLERAILWYHPHLQQAATFWTHLGFVPLWTTYQRRAEALLPTEKEAS